MLFLLRFMATKAAVSSPFFILKPMDLRLCSPVSGGSTLVTTAPMSARTWQQNGPAITCVRSRTFSFSSGNIVTRTLHLAVAYAFDHGSLLLPRGHPPPAQGAYASYQVIVKEHRGRIHFPKSPAQTALVLHRAGVCRRTPVHQP